MQCAWVSCHQKECPEHGLQGRNDRAYAGNSSIDFKGIAAAALANAKSLLIEWLPGGRFEGHEYVALNPTRNDSALGSFKMNWHTGKWSDFADPHAKGGDLISLFAYINRLDHGQAARQIAERLGIPANHGAALPTRRRPDDLVVHSFSPKPRSPNRKHPSATKGSRVVDAKYDYKDENRALLYQVIKYKPWRLDLEYR